MNQTPNPGGNEKTRSALAALIPAILVEEYALFACARHYRRHLQGPNSHSLHKLLDDQTEQIEHWLAELWQCAHLAELGHCEGVDCCTSPSFAPAAMTPAGSATQMLHDLRTRHDALGRRLRTETALLRDSPTVQLLQRLADFHDTAVWILRVVAEGPGPVGAEENYFCGAPDPSRRV